MSLFVLNMQVIVKIPVEDRKLDGVLNFPCEASWNVCAVILTHRQKSRTFRAR